MVDAGGPVEIGIEGAGDLVAVVLADEGSGVAKVGERVETILNALGDWGDAVGGKAVAGERRVGGEGIADGGGVREVTGAPRGERDGGIEQLLNGAAAGGFVGGVVSPNRRN